jgi:hypothetical protein
MMKIIICLFVMLIPFVFVNAQDNYKDLNNMSVSGGVTDIGAIYQIGYYKAVREKLRIRASGYFEIASKKLSKIQNVGLDVSGQYLVGGFGKTMNLHVGVGGTVSTVNQNSLNKTTFNQSTSKLMYGVVGNVECEFAISYEVSLFINYNQRYLFSSIYGSKWYDLSAGIKLYIFN